MNQTETKEEVNWKEEAEKLQIAGQALQDMITLKDDGTFRRSLLISLNQIGSNLQSLHSLIASFKESASPADAS